MHAVHKLVHGAKIVYAVILVVDIEEHVILADQGKYLVALSRKLLLSCLIAHNGGHRIEVGEAVGGEGEMSVTCPILSATTAPPLFL